jgi:hypothetical protein
VEALRVDGRFESCRGLQRLNRLKKTAVVAVTIDGAGNTTTSAPIVVRVIAS